MSFAIPLALVAFVGVPALAAIYWLRNRFRRHPVSSLILWMNQRQAREGGSRIQRLRVPLLFFLELAAIALLVVAAARPVVYVGKAARPLIVVLDDSYSMLAGGAETPRERAIAAVEREVRRNPYYSVRFVVAGRKPQLLGEAARTAREVAAALKGWRCRSQTDCVEAAVTFAAELGGSRGRILVVTDRPPTKDVGGERVKWWAFGDPQPNVAFVNATRATLDGRERCLIEIANLSSEPAQTTLTLDGASEHPQRSTVKLAPRETRRLVFEFDEHAEALRARLSDDALAIDNGLVLLPHPVRPVRVQVRVADEDLRPLVENALSATKHALLVADRAELVVTDRAGYRASAPEAWVLHLLADEEAEPYVGPFVLDRTHPLTEGLSLDGVVWGGGKAEQLAGLPVVSAGNTPLLTDAQSLTGRHDVRLRLRPDLSTLQDTPNWPILMWNLVEWRASHAPGLRQTNLRLGMEAVLTVDAGTESVRVVAPDGAAREVPVHAKTVTLGADDVGVYELETDAGKQAFAVNALYRQESDLTKAAPGRWGDWAAATMLRWEYRSIAWMFLLAALAVLVGHTIIAARRT
jgi:hypothetical protein